MAKPNIVVYLRPTCPWALEVRDLLKKHNLSYETRDIVSNPKHYDDMVKRTGQERSPCVEVDGQMIVDVGGAEVEALLLEKGAIKKG